MNVSWTFSELLGLDVQYLIAKSLETPLLAFWCFLAYNHYGQIWNPAPDPTHPPIQPPPRWKLVLARVLDPSCQDKTIMVPTFEGFENDFHDSFSGPFSFVCHALFKRLRALLLLGNA